MKRPILSGFGTDHLTWDEAFTQEIVERIHAEVPKKYRTFAISFLAFRLLSYAGSMRDAGWELKAIGYEMGGLIEKLEMGGLIEKLHAHMRVIETIMKDEMKKTGKRRVSSAKTMRKA